MVERGVVRDRSAMGEEVRPPTIILCTIRGCRICLSKTLKPSTPALVVVRECRAFLFTATTNASYAIAISMTAARARSARVDMKFLSDLFKYPMNLKSLLSGMVVALAAFLPILIALIVIRIFTGC